jgi:hypothetical protein
MAGPRRAGLRRRGQASADREISGESPPSLALPTNRQIIEPGDRGVEIMKRFLLLLTLVLGVLAAAAPAFADETAHAEDKPKAEKGPDKPGAEAAHVRHAPVKMKLGVHVIGLSKLELGPGSYNAEFILTVTCDREPCKGDIDTSNGKITGKELLHDEPLKKIFKMKAELAGNIDLGEFPFDAHVLPISLEDKEDPENTTVELDKEHTSIDDDIKLAGWTLTKWEAHVEKEEIGDGKHISQLVYGVDIERPRAAGLLKSIVPVLFMVMVAGLTLLLKPKSAVARMTAATGALLTIVAFHISSTSSLPPLGYLTRMDKFMVANYFIYLVNIAFAVAIVRADDDKNEELAKKLYQQAWIAVPVVTVLAWGAVFSRIL